jgi:hypothetical protein
MHGFFGCRLRMTEGEGMAVGKSKASEKVTASQVALIQTICALLIQQHRSCDRF